MHTAGTGDHETIEDIAARILVEALGYRSNWHADDARHGADNRDEDGTPMWIRPDTLPVRHCVDVEEGAARYLPSDYEKWPAWATYLPPDRQAELVAWSDANPLQTRRGDIGEFEGWSKTYVEVSLPSASHGTRAAIALADAKLAGPLESILRAYVMEDRQSAETVIRYAVAAGHRREVALNALVHRIAFPDQRHLHRSTVKQRAAQLRMRESAYQTAEDAAAGLLRRWLHTACQRFVRAHGFVPRTSVPSITLKYVAPRRARPRFAHGWDARQQPGPEFTREANGRASAPVKDGSSDRERIVPYPPCESGAPCADTWPRVSYSARGSFWLHEHNEN